MGEFRDVEANASRRLNPFDAIFLDQVLVIGIGIIVLLVTGG